MEPWFGPEEKKAINEYMEDPGWMTEFKKTEEFERMISEYTGAKHCIVVNNGSVTLTIGALACGLEAGDEVIIPNYTQIVTPNSVLLFGAKPIFVDVEKETLCLDIEKVKSAITSKTKAIMLVTANGRYPKARINTFENLARENNLFLFEDSAQSLGSFFPDGRHIGTAGIWGSFSFSSQKVVTTGQGGAIITNDDGVADRIRRIKDFGRAKGGIDVHDSIGYNFKFTELQAIIGIEQMKKLPWRVERKKEMLKRYKSNLKTLKQISFFSQDLENTTPWFIDMLVDDRDDLVEYLKSKNIATRLMYPPINKQACYQVSGEHEVSNFVGRNGLWLPSQAQLADMDIDYICDCIKEFYESN